MIDLWANLPDWNKPFNVIQEMFDEIYCEAMSQTAFAFDFKINDITGSYSEISPNNPTVP